MTYSTLLTILTLSKLSPDLVTASDSQVLRTFTMLRTTYIAERQWSLHIGFIWRLRRFQYNSKFKDICVFSTTENVCYFGDQVLESSMVRVNKYGPLSIFALSCLVEVLDCRKY
jgi:hypothetical protein